VAVLSYDVLAPSKDHTAAYAVAVRNLYDAALRLVVTIQHMYNTLLLLTLSMT
jgi:hypothetical protein